MMQTSRRNTWAERRVQLSNWHAYVSVGSFVMMGALMFYAAFGEGRKMRLLLASPDAIFGISNHILLLIAAIVHFALGIYLLAKSDQFTRGVVIIWAGLTYLTYRLGMAWSSTPNQFSCMQAVAESIGVEPVKLDRVWLLVILFYIGSGVAILTLEWRCWRQGKENTFVERWRAYRISSELAATKGKSWVVESSAVSCLRKAKLLIEAENGDFKFICPNCGQHIRCNAGYSGREIACPGCKKAVIAIQSAELKMSCFFCQGNIVFEAHSAGTRLPCPHCKMDITLMDTQ